MSSAECDIDVLSDFRNADGKFMEKGEWFPSFFKIVSEGKKKWLIVSDCSRTSAWNTVVEMERVAAGQKGLVPLRHPCTARKEYS